MNEKDNVDLIIIELAKRLLELTGCSCDEHNDVSCEWLEGYQKQASIILSSIMKPSLDELIDIADTVCNAHHACCLDTEMIEKLSTEIKKVKALMKTGGKQ